MSYSQIIEDYSVVFNEEQDYLDIRAEYLTLHDDIQSGVSCITFLEFLQFDFPNNKNFEVMRTPLGLPQDVMAQLQQPSTDQNYTIASDHWDPPPLAGNPVHVAHYIQDSAGNFVEGNTNPQIYIENHGQSSSGSSTSTYTSYNINTYEMGEVSGIEWGMAGPEVEEKPKKVVKKKRKNKSKGESISRFDILDL